jgi:seryl-tRNA synthetase
MLTINRITQNPEEIIRLLKVKHFDATMVVEKILDLDQKRRLTQKELDDMLSEANNLSKEIGKLFAEKKIQDAERLKVRTFELKDQSKQHADELSSIELQIRNLLIEMPNVPHVSVPEGNSELDNVEIRKGGTIPQLIPNALPHWEIASKANIIDFELGNKLTGAGFPVYKNKGAKLQRALINFFLDKATAKGYEEIQPPLMVNENSAFGTGQLPDKEAQMYHVSLYNFYLIPTAEVPVTNIYSNAILELKELPVKMTAYTPCFRREAGSYGKNVRGLNRVHQFDKVEIVQIQHPDKSYETLDEMIDHVESLLNLLGLPYRIIRLCGKDMSFASALTYDFEVFSAAQERWLEVSSVSNFETFQTSRMMLRYRDENKKPQLAHTLNGSALALPRIVAALLENNQQADHIVIPDVLIPYTGFERIEYKK